MKIKPVKADAVIIEGVITFIYARCTYSALKKESLKALFPGHKIISVMITPIERKSVKKSLRRK